MDQSSPLPYSYDLLNAFTVNSSPGGGVWTPDQQESYRGARITRLWQDWLPPHRSGDAAISDSYDLILARIRELCRDDPSMKASKRGLAKLVIGPGIQAFADALQDGSWDDYDDDLFNDPSDFAFERWSERKECDIRGKQTLPEMQWSAFNEMMEGGEAIWLKCFDKTPGRTVRLAYQLLETEQLDGSQEWPASKDRNLCRRGIEYDTNGRPVAYWIYDAHPYDDLAGTSAWGKSTRIPADRVIHTFIPNRISENRGITWFTNLQSAKDLDWYVGNELTAAAIGALFTAVIKRENGQGSGLGFTAAGGDAGTSDSGNAGMRLGRGIIADMGKNDDVKIVESSRANRDANPFIKLILMLQGMGTGLSYLRLTSDYSQSSYTSARGAHLDDQAFIVVLQEFCCGNFVKPMRLEHQRQAVLNGLIKGMTPRKYLDHQLRLECLFAQPPGREQLDPEAETQAAMSRMRSGLSTLAEECGKRGYHWRKTLRQRAREEKFAEKVLGHPLDLNQSQGYAMEMQARKERREAKDAPPKNGRPA